MLIEESLHCQYMGFKDRIGLSNSIIKDQVRNP